MQHTAASEQQFSVRFWGVRGSYPTPGPGTVKVGGNTTCVEVRVGDHLIILDAGTGLVGLGDKLMDRFTGRAPSPAKGRPIVATILLTHTHHDHIQGIPFFKPIFLPTTSLYIFGPKAALRDLEEQLAHNLISPFFPIELDDMESFRHVKNIRPSDMLILDGTHEEPRTVNIYRGEGDSGTGGARMRVMKSFAHPKAGSLIYRIESQGKSLVFATDTECYHGEDTRLATFAKGADMLIHDAQYTHEEYVGITGAPRQGYGHSTPENACAVARNAGAGQLILFHHDPTHDDAAMEGIERGAQEHFPNTQIAREGDTYVL